MPPRPATETEDGWVMKRRSTLGVPVIRGDAPDPETQDEIKAAVKDILELAEIILSKPELTEPRVIRLSGTPFSVTSVRLGPEATAEVRRIYRRHFGGPAVRIIPANDIEDVRAFYLPAEAVYSRYAGSMQKFVHLALSLKDGTHHHWNYWGAYSGLDGTPYRNAWRGAMRSAVRPECDEFYDQRKRAAGGAPLTCAVCGVAETDTPHQVDHCQPSFFSRILVEFCRLKGLERSDGRIESCIMARKTREGEIGNYHPLTPVMLETVPPSLATDFAAYHRSFAKELRILCAPCNRKEAATVPRKIKQYTIGGRLVAERLGPHDRDRPVSPVEETYRVTLVPPQPQ